jgi:hypothetical protein
MSQGMPAWAMKVKTSRTVVITDITCSAKRRADSLPSPSRRRAYCGTKAALNAPSAKRLRNRFGKRWATKKASAARPGAERVGDQDVADKTEHPARQRVATDGENGADEIHGRAV